MGFSLLELMVVVSITAILLTVGIPSFQSTMLRARGAALADTLITSIYFARSEAVSRNALVSLCASIDGVACNGAATNWNSGWIAVDATNNLIKTWEVDAATSIVRLFNQANVVNDPNRLVFNSLGEASLRNGAGLDLGATTIVLTTEVVNCGVNQERNIRVGNPGNVIVDRVNC
jgi:type IV fimbrial biogenesis protein FimT